MNRNTAKEINNVSYLLKILYGWAAVEMRNGNYDKARPLLEEGYTIAKQQKKVTESYAFASMLYIIKKKEQKPVNVKFNNENILNYYNKIKAEKPLNIWTRYLENSIALSYYSEKGRKY
jgi:predicted Zn-dependent protease